MRRKNNFSKFILTILFIAILVGAGFVYLSPQFEQTKPKIEFESNEYWNLKDKLKINVSDDSGLKYYKVTFIDGENKIVLAEKILNNNKIKNITLEINPPKIDIFYKGENVKINVIVVDNSKWNFLNGNEQNYTYDIKVDKTKPIANIVNNSEFIKRGGSAVVIVKVKDKNLKEAYITFNDKVKFKLTPFYKDNYYISLIAWPIDIDEFYRVNLVAIDKAMNKTITKVPLYLQRFIFQKDTIKISEKFIKNVSKNVLEKSNIEVPNGLKKIFLKENNDLRKLNVNLLREIGKKKMDYSKVNSFKLKLFKRLKGSKKVANYADRRSYIFNDDVIDKQWHLGIDWAKIKHTTIRSSNDGTVIFNEYLGIYGNTIIIDHTFGLASLYAHTSNTNVNVGDKVYKNSKLGTTGISGAVLGDHLHFGILVQGIEVDPVEWMDRNWVKKRITNIIKQAKKSINKK